MTESSEEEVALSERIKTAEDVYMQLVNSIKTLTQTDHPLMGPTLEARENRSLLLGREKDQDTTWEELWQGRLRFDVKLHNVGISLDKGKISSEKYVEETVKLSTSEKGNYEIPNDLLVTLKVILKGFPRHDQQRFTYKDGSLRKRSIAYLFGLYSGSKNNTLEDIELRISNLNYGMLRSMLLRCIELAQSNERVSDDRRKNSKAQLSRGRRLVKVGGLVTENIAKRVFAWVNDPKGENLPLVDTSLYDEKTVESLTNYFSEHFLDGKRIDLLRKEQTISRKTMLPKVEHEICRLEGHKKFTVAAIQNVLSPTAVEEIVNLINKETFVQGVGGNKSKAYVRVSSLTGAPFVVSGGKTIYGSVNFTEVDHILKSYFDKLMGVQRSTIEKCTGADFKQTVGCNMLHILVGHFKNAKYDYHSDFGCYLCTDPTHDGVRIYSGEGRAYLPLREEQQTYTIVITIGAKEINATLKHRDTGSKKTLTTLHLGSACAHIQFAHTQEAWLEHGVEKEKGKDIIESPGAVRIVITARCSIPKNHPSYRQQYIKTVGSDDKFDENNWNSDYCYTNVINTIQSIDACNDNVEDNENDAVLLDKTMGRRKKAPLPSTQGNLPGKNDQWIDLCDEETTDRYRKIPNQWFDSLNIQRPPSQGSLKQPLSVCLFDYRLVYVLFRAGYLVEVPVTYKVQKEGNPTEWRSLIPRVPRSKKKEDRITMQIQDKDLEFLKPGKICSLDWVAQLLSLEMSERRRQPYNQSANKVRGILCSQAYKNRMDMVIEQIKHIVMRADVQEKGLLPSLAAEDYIPISNPLFGGRQCCYGFGGSPTVQGANAPTPKNDSKDDSGIIFSIGQGLCVPDTKSSDSGSGLLDDNVAFFRQYYQEGSIFLYFWDEMQLLGGEKALKHLVDPRITTSDFAKSSCRFVNYMIVEDWTLKGPMLPDEIVKEYNGFSSRVKKYLSFRENKHNHIMMRPFFSDEDYALMETREKSNFKYKQLQVPQDSNMEVTFATPPGNPHRLYDITNENRLTLTDIYRQVATSGVLDKFWSNKHEFPPTDEELGDNNGERTSATTTNEITDEDTDIEREQHMYDELSTDSLKQYNPVLVEAARESLSKGTAGADKKGLEKTAVIAEFSRALHAAMRKFEDEEKGTANVDNLDLREMTRKRGTSMSIRDTCLCALFVNAAGAYRYKKLGDCLRSEAPPEYKKAKEREDANKNETEKNAIPRKTPRKKRKREQEHCSADKNKTPPGDGEKKCYGSPLMIDKLGTALRLNSHPMSNRYLDTVPVALRREALRRGWTTVRNATRQLDINSIADKNVLMEAMYAATLLRFTGRVSRFALFQQWSGNREQVFLPKWGDSTSDFLSFVQKTVMGNSGHGYAMSQWLSGQHFEAIPRGIRSHYSLFEELVKKMEDGMELLVDSIITLCQQLQNKQVDMRKEIVKVITGHVRGWCSDDSKGNIEFLAQQVVADVEGLFGYVFGEPRAEGIMAGHAGDLGYLMIVWAMDKEETPTLAEILQQIVDGVQKGKYFNDEWLGIGGYERNSDNVVVNKVNGLPFNVTDAEHWLCKAWVIVKKTFNHYRNSMYPVPLEPHYHPIKWPGRKTPLSITNDGKVDGVMQDIIELFHKWTEVDDLVQEKEENALKLPEILEM